MQCYLHISTADGISVLHFFYLSVILLFLYLCWYWGIFQMMKKSFSTNYVHLSDMHKQFVYHIDGWETRLCRRHFFNSLNMTCFWSPVSVWCNRLKEPVVHFNLAPYFFWSILITFGYYWKRKPIQKKHETILKMKKIDYWFRSCYEFAMIFGFNLAINLLWFILTDLVYDREKKSSRISEEVLKIQRTDCWSRTCSLTFQMQDISQINALECLIISFCFT